jgi:four helix bundle protein
MKSYRDLFIWQASVELAKRVIECTDDFPQRQRRVLVEQMQRCAVSIPSNIAEGKGRLTAKELRHYLGIARGSLLELATQLEIASRLELLNHDQQTGLTEHIKKIGAGINALLRTLNPPP